MRKQGRVVREKAGERFADHGSHVVTNVPISEELSDWVA